MPRIFCGASLAVTEISCSRLTHASTLEDVIHSTAAGALLGPFQHTGAAGRHTLRMPAVDVAPRRSTPPLRVHMHSLTSGLHFSTECSDSYSSS